MSQFSESFQIELRSSPLLGWFIFLTHGGILALMPFLTIPLWLNIGITLGVILSLTTAFCNHVLICSKYAIIILRWSKSGDWKLVYTDGTVCNAQLLPDKFIHPYLVVLNFRIAQRISFLSQKSVILVFDSINSKTFRHLRARLQAEHYNSE